MCTCTCTYMYVLWLHFVNFEPAGSLETYLIHTSASISTNILCQCTCTCICVYIVHVYMYSYIHYTCTCTCMCTWKGTHMYMHTCIHKLVHCKLSLLSDKHTHKTILQQDQGAQLELVQYVLYRLPSRWRHVREGIV